MARVKILFIHHGTGLGGAPLSLLYLINGLNKDQYEPVVLFLHNSEVVQLYQDHGIQTYGPVNFSDFSHTKMSWIPWYRPDKLYTTLKSLSATTLYAAKKWLTLIKPDIVHLNTSTLAAWAYVAKKNKIPVVWHIRESLSSGYYGLRKKIIIKSVATYSDAIIPICNHDAKPWLQLSKTSVIYNPVDATYFNANQSSADFLTEYNLLLHTPKILFLGGFAQQKGCLELLEIFSIFLQKVPHAQLLLAGYNTLNIPSSFIQTLSPNYTYQQKIKTLLLSLNKSVIPLGPIKNVSAAMAASFVVVFPATVDHFARPVIEAGFMKKPVIASKLPQLQELIINETTGFLEDLHDYSAWVDKLTLLYTNKERAALMGEQAQDFCIKKFDSKRHTEQIEQIYRKIKKQCAINSM